MKIMYVEDNPANLFLVKRIARQGGHDVINFVDGGEALQNFHEIAPDLVLMDVQLSGEINGLQVVESLRGQGVSTPIIAVTAYAMVGDRERCLEAGCDDYIAKPLPIARLLEIFDRYGKRAIGSQRKFKSSTSETIAVDASNASAINNHAPSVVDEADEADKVTASNHTSPVVDEADKVDKVTANDHASPVVDEADKADEMKKVNEAPAVLLPVVMPYVAEPITEAASPVTPAPEPDVQAQPHPDNDDAEMDETTRPNRTTLTQGMTEDGEDAANRPTESAT